MIPKLLNADWNYWPEGHAAESLWTSSAKLGFDGIELGVYDVADQLSEAKVTEYVRLTDAHGLAVGTVLYSMPPARWPEGGLGHPQHATEAIRGALDTAKVGRDAFGCHVRVHASVFSVTIAGPHQIFRKDCREPQQDGLGATRISDVVAQCVSCRQRR